MIITTKQRLFVGYDYPRKENCNGRIYLDNEHFGNFFQQNDKDLTTNFADFYQKWFFNRDTKALRMGLPAIQMQDSLDDIINLIVDWLEKESIS